MKIAHILGKKPVANAIKLALVGTTAAVMTGLTGCDSNSSSYNLTRLATLPLGSEATGLFINTEGDLFFNVQHPSSSANIEPHNRASVGAVVGYNINDLPMDFEGVPAPTGSAKQTVITAVGAYQILGQNGDILPNGDTLGAILNADGSVLKESNDPDFNAFVADGEGRGFLFSNWEDRPGGMSRMELVKNADGKWDMINGNMVDFSAVKGTWVNCFGTLSPWNTPLTSEENFTSDLASWNDVSSSTYQSRTSPLKLHLDEFPNPYRYGYIVEITEPATTATPEKRFAMGRYSHENSVVMPDDKTVYLTDDGGSRAFFKFVADQAGDLSSGTLYAARVSQDRNEKGEMIRDNAVAGFNINWVELAHGTDAEIGNWIAEFDSVDEDDFVAGETSYISDEEVALWAIGKADNDRAAFLESRKAAAAKGATVEFNKMEGININYNTVKAIQEDPENNAVPYMYVAISDVTGAMSDTSGDIQVDTNRCGVVYRLPLDANYNAGRMEPIVAGGEYDPNAGANRCDVNNVSSPDNVIIMDDGRVIIGEDTSKHENNMIWVYQEK